MARRRIYLMRHVDVQYFVTDREPAASQSVELTERGHEQARAAGRALRTVRFDRVITSGLDRVNIALNRLIADESWETALVVLHGGVNRAIFSRAITGTPVFLGRLEQTPGCINILDHGPDWFVRAINVIRDNPARVGPRESSLEEIADAYRAYRGYSVPGPR